MSARARWPALDVARGLAVAAMIVFHLIWDLGHFGYIAPTIPWSAPIRIFGHAIAFSFLLIAGVSLSLAHRDHMRWPAFWRRLALVFGAAALVSAGTYIVFPTAYVFFGILHCIGAASLIAAPFLFAPWGATLIAGALILAAPEFVSSPTFNADWLQWLGLGTREPLTNDWRPILPWAGALLIGAGAGRAMLSRSKEDESRAMCSGSSVGEGLTFLGRHSLPIYLAHQPLLFALFAGLALIAPQKGDARDFVESCETRCVADGGVKAACHDICLCTEHDARGDGIFSAAKDDDARGRRLNELARRCAERR